MLKMLFMPVMAMTMMAIVFEWSFPGAGEEVLEAAVVVVVVVEEEAEEEEEVVVVGLLGVDMDLPPDVQNTE